MNPIDNIAETALRENTLPPSKIPTWQWIEENVVLPPSVSDFSGPVRFEFFPASKILLDGLDQSRVRKCTALKCSQSGITTLATWYLMRRVKENPTTTMWVGAKADKAEEDAKKYMWPAMEYCAAVKGLCPRAEDRERWTKKLVMFDTMHLMIRGSESRVGLQGDPAGLIICDERREWKPGRIHLLRKRTRTKIHPLEISIGAAGKKGDELHADWLEGSQTFIHFTCPNCQHSQPWRFGRNATTLFPDARERGGVVWDENDLTKPDGRWDYAAVRKSARYECEACGERFLNSQKLALLKTSHAHHRKPEALPENFSLHINALVLPFAETEWGDIAVEFLKAVESMKFGDIEPMIAFVTETLGEPWELRNEKQKESELLDRCGDYKLGEMWLGPDGQIEANTTLVLTFDRQQFHLVYVIRQWRKNGQSRLIDCGLKASYDDLRALQIEMKIKSRCVWGDDGGKFTSEFRQTALKYNWQVIKGEDVQHFNFTDKDESKSWRQGWRATEFDPGIGTVNQNRVTMTAYLHSSPHYKEKLYNLFIVGKGPLWEIPKDVPKDYVRELLSNEWRERTMNDGQVVGYWHECGPDHFCDCELEQLAVADIGGVTRLLPQSQREKPH